MSTDVDAGGRRPRLLVVVHPDRPVVLDTLTTAPGDDEPTWVAAMAAVARLVPDGAWPLGPDVRTRAGDVHVMLARTARTTAGSTWTDDPPRSWPEPVRASVRQLLGELDDPAMTSGRPRWMRRGWWDAATAWVDDALAAAGLGERVGPLEPHRHWSISSVGRVSISGARAAWIKAVPPHFAREPRVLAVLGGLLGQLPCLDGVAPPRVPRLLASRDDGPEGALLLLADSGTVPDEVSAGEPPRLAAGLARLQAGSAVHLPRLRADGDLDDRSPAALAAGLARLADDAVELDRLEPHERTALRKAVPAWQDRLLALAESPLPSVLVHGDFHPWNVVRAPEWAEGEEIVIDWTDAAAGPAGADLVTLVRRDVPGSGGDTVAAYASVWAQAIGASPHTVRAAVDAAVPAGFVVQALAFDGILRAAEPRSRWQNSGALAANLRALLAAGT